MRELGGLGDRFDDYRAACEGADFNWSSMAWMIRDADKAVRIYERLVDAGFEPIMKPEVMDVLEREVGLMQRSVLDARERLERFEAIARKSGRSLYPFQRRDVLWMASRRFLVNCNQQGLGKAQPYDEPVLTPHGFVRIGDLRVGDEVIGQDGYPCRVEAVYRRGVRKVFRVEFNDGSFTRCYDEHLWNVRDANAQATKSAWKTIPLSQIRSRLRTKTNWLHYVPMMKPARMRERDTPLDPYLLGALLGDGGMSQSHSHVVLTSADSDILRRCSDALPENLHLNLISGSKYDYKIVQKSGRTKGGNDVLNAIRMLGLHRKNSSEKFVPEIYKFNCVEVRLEVLRGLMDTDGTVSADGFHTEFNTCSAQLADDVAFLIQSLGGVARRRERITCSGNTDYRVNVSLPAEFNPFWLERKAIRVKPRTKYKPNRVVTSVTEDGECEVVCIKVSSFDELYVTRNCIVTHNTIESLCSIPDASETGVIVACPAIAKGVWKRECERWRPDLRPTVLNGLGSFRWPERGELLIANYELLPLQVPAPPRDMFDRIVVFGDEAHYLKNKRTRRSRSFKAVIEYAARVALLTGTPLPNKPDELWALLDLIGIAREAYGSKKKFAECFNGVELWEPCKRCPVCWAAMKAAAPDLAQVGDEEEMGSDLEQDLFVDANGGEPGVCPNRMWRGYEWGMPTGESGRRLQRVLVRHLRTEVLPDLPGKTRRFIPIECEENKEALDGYLDEMPELLRAQSIKDIPFDKLSRARALLTRLKLKAVEELVTVHEEANDPVVVFSAHRHVVEALAKRPGWMAITGEVKNRNQIEDDFQARKLRGIAATIQAASTAITLTQACQAYFVDLSYVPADNEQSEDRICRIGQTRGVTINYLVLDHVIDRHVIDLIARKQGIIEGSVELARGEKLINEDDALDLVPKFVRKPFIVPSSLRGPKNEEEIKAMALVRTLGGFNLENKDEPWVEKVRDKMLSAHKRAMSDMALDDYLYEKVSNGCWTVAKQIYKRYKLLVDKTRAAEPSAPRS